MEGDCLLQRLKDGSHMESLLSDIQVYLGHGSRHKAPPTDETANKYGLTALKMLRACVQTISSLPLGSHHLSTVTGIAHTCYKYIKNTKDQMKITPLSLEKVLFHIMLQLVNKSLLMDALSFADHLYAELSSSRPKFENADGVDNEFDTVAKQAFNQLWKACAQIEESSKTGARHVLVLNARRHALALLMLTNQETSWVSERALRAALEIERRAGKDPACPEHLYQFFSDLTNRVLETLHGKQMKSKLEAGMAKVLGPVLELCLQFAKYSILTGKKKDSIELVRKVHKYASTSKTHSSKQICAICDTILATVTLSDLHTLAKSEGSKSSKSVKHGNVPTEVCEQLCNACDILAKVVETRSFEPSLYQLLVDTNELLRKQLDSVVGKGSHQDSMIDLCQVSYRILATYMDILEVYKDHLSQKFPCPTDIYRGMPVMHFTSRLVQKQLAALNFLGNLTILELNMSKHVTISVQDKEKFGSQALSICKRTKAVMEDVSKGGGGVISVNEHRWLGSNAFNLGLICYKKAWYDFAEKLLQLSCEQFQRWCSTEQGIDVTKAKEIQLATKYELLVDCQRRAGRHRDAMVTVALSLLVVPDLEVSDIASRAEQWVKAKRDALKKAEDPDLRNRTLLDECQEMEEELTGNHLSVIAAGLDEELKVYKTQRHDTSVEQYAVIQDQLRLYAGDGCVLQRANAFIQLARLVYSSGLDSECSSEESCTQAIKLLEGLQEGEVRVHLDLLAQAKFWLCLAEMESSIQDSRSSTSSDLNGDLSQESSTLDISDNTSTACTLDQETQLLEHLETALGIWTSLLLQEGEGDIELECFHDPASTLQCLQLAADIMAACGKPLAEIKVLIMLSKLSRASSLFVQAVESDLQLTQLLAQAGLTTHADTVLARAEKLVGNVTGSQQDVLIAELGLAKCLVCLSSGQVQQFEKSFAKYLEKTSKGTGRRNCRTYLRSAATKELQASYLSLPLTSRSTQCDRLTLDEYEDDLSPLDLLMEAMRLRMGVAKIVMGTDMKESSDHTDGDSGQQSESRWRVLSCVLQSLSQVAHMFCQQGCVREAQCYITEGMALAQKFQLPRRCARFLQQLIEVHIKWGQEEECQSALATLKAILPANEHHSQPKPAKAKAKTDKGSKTKGKSKPKRAASKEIEESDEDDFIKTRPLSVSSSLATRINRDVSNSPNLKQSSASKPKLPDYVQHQLGCSCDQCEDVSRHELDVGYSLSCARLSVLTCNHSVAGSALTNARELLEWSKGRLHKVFAQTIPQIGEDKDLSWRPHLRDLGILLSIQAEVDIELERPDRAIETAREGLVLFQESSIALNFHSPVATFYYLIAVASIQKEGKTFEDSSWILLENDSQSQVENGSEVDDITHTLSELKVCESVKRVPKVEADRPTCGLFQGMLDMSSAKPERTRKRDSGSSAHGAVLSEELGLFSDVVLDETADFPEPASLKEKPSKGKGRSNSAVQVTTKKGAVTYKLASKQGKTKKSSANEHIATSAYDTEVFSFDEEPTNDKKSTRSKGKRVCSRKNPPTTTDSVNDKCSTERAGESTVSKSGNSRSRRGKSGKTATQEPPSVASNDELFEMVNEVISSFSDNVATDAEESIDVKPKRGRGRKTREPAAGAVQKETKSRGRRGRAAKEDSEASEVEHIRGTIPDPDPVIPPKLTLDESIEDLLPVDSPTMSSSSPSIPDSPPRLDFSFEESRPAGHRPEILVSENVAGHQLKSMKAPHSSSSSSVSESSVVCPLQADDSSLIDEQSLVSSSFPDKAVNLDNSAHMLLSESQEVFDDIEIPRAASDSEDASTKGRRRGRGVRKTTARKKAEDDDMVCEDDDDDSTKPVKGNRKKESKTSRRGTKKSSSGVVDKATSDTILTDLSCIREHLEHAYDLMKHLAPSPLYRHVCQLLALCHGDASPLESARCLGQAASVTLRHQKLASINKKLRKLRKASEKEEEGLVSAMTGLSINQSPKEEEERLSEAKKHFSFGRSDATNIVKSITSALPKDFTVCQLSMVSAKPSHINTLTSSSQLILTRIQQGQEPQVTRLPMVGGETVVADFERILNESKEMVKETDKKVWWTTRQRLDEEMQNLTKDMENNLLGSWKGLVLGSYGDPKAQNKLKGLAQKLQQSVLDAGGKRTQATLCECLIDSYQHLSHQQINSALYCLSGCKPGTEDLTRLAATLKDLAKKWQETKPEHRNPVILILDTTIQQLPWESMPILQPWPVCRLPSLHFLLSHLTASDRGQSVLNGGVDSRKTYFVLNPTGDLVNTQKTFQEWFQEENKWKGVIGKAPTKPEYQSALTDHDLFVFCGHGTGREFLTGDDIQRLTCRAATLLIGCSSGKLQVSGCLDASGMALNYLLAECPCVVANLWDVTDRDIDRFLEYLLKAWLATGSKTTPSSESKSLASLLCDARQACKLKHLIGYSPVVYGLPVTMKER